MQCPFLNKINFNKINQIYNDDTVFEQTVYEQSIISSSTNYLQLDVQIPQQTIKLANPSSIKNHNIYCFSNRLNTPQSSNSKLQIKYPKQLETKHMIIKSLSIISQMQKQNNDYDESLIGDQQLTQQKYIPHILISKSSMMAITNCQTFYGDVILMEEPQNKYKCQVRDAKIKIYRQHKIKYFIELQHVQYYIKNINITQILLSAECKSTKIQLQLQFSCPKKVIAFIQAVEINTIQTKQKQSQFLISNPSNDQKLLSSSYSIDSLGFQVQRMSLQKLKQVGDTFDIILFKNKSWMSKMQRIFTNSDYDHVVMLLKTTSNQIFVLQASGNSGVAVYTLDSLIGLPKGKYYFRIAFRKYQGERKIASIVKLQQFIRESIGKKYKFNPMYLISSQVQKQNTYFCSELIAESLMKSGIMSSNKPAYKYLPKHFTGDTLNQDIIDGFYSDIVVIQ